MIKDCEYFTVMGETDEFVVIQLDTAARFKGRRIFCLTGQDICDFAQFLFDEYGLAQVGSGGGSLICRKVRHD